MKFEIEKIKADNYRTTKFLNQTIEEKDKEIKQLKKGNSKNIEKYAREDFICINFQNPHYNYSLPCLNTDIFAEVEEKYYQEYPELRETNNIFLYNGSPILRFKTIADNKINKFLKVFTIKILFFFNAHLKIYKRLNFHLLLIVNMYNVNIFGLKK